ncbi:hypothetical protein MRB53_024808 [Persea americana]|uniref:Uncharacterized protein n=1 Tax=Persea americana TaxID=3435 RepID=A0ACC2LDF5_PERAE|nr:hypothetical protein MRB53_024808 [Persea americana]
MLVFAALQRMGADSEVRVVESEELSSASDPAKPIYIRYGQQDKMMLSMLPPPPHVVELSNCQQPHSFSSQTNTIQNKLNKAALIVPFLFFNVFCVLVFKSLVWSTQ